MVRTRPTQMTIHERLQQSIEDEVPSDDDSQERLQRGTEKSLKTVVGEQQKKSLNAILIERKAIKKQAPLFKTPKRRMDSDSLHEWSEESDGDGAIVPEKIFQELQAKYRNIKKDKQDLQKDLEYSKQKCTKLEQKNKDLEKELDNYRGAKLALQANLNEVLQRAFSNNSQFLSQPASSQLSPQQASSQLSPQQASSQVSPQQASSQVSPQQASSQVSTQPARPQPESAQPATSQPAGFERKDGKINIGEDIWLREEVWRKINCTTKDSIYVKELAVAIWGTVGLRSRSISGTECPTKTGEAAKPPLTPTKLAKLKDCFRGRLNTLHLEKAELTKREKLVGHYISQKIQDIGRKSKKETC